MDMERVRLNGNTEKEVEYVESQEQRKPERNWGHILYNSIWYIIFLVLILSTLVGLSILTVRIGREGDIEVLMEEVDPNNTSEPIHYMQHVGIEPPRQMDNGRLVGKSYVIPIRGPILYVAREEVHRTPVGADAGSGNQLKGKNV